MSVLYRSNSKEETFSEGEHIIVYDNFFSPELCQKFIDYFEYRSKLAHKRNHAKTKDLSVNIGTEMAMRQENELVLSNGDSDECLPEFLQIFWDKCFPIYQASHPHLMEGIAPFGFSVVKLQKTLPSEGYHVWHCEHGSMETGRRLMFVILYLNDVLEGGETEFIYQKTRVEASQGRLVLSPSSYTHTHRGNPPLSGEKYILTSWIEFIK